MWTDKEQNSSDGQGFGDSTLVALTSIESGLGFIAVLDPLTRHIRLLSSPH